jgi:hypothetical protein
VKSEPWIKVPLSVTKIRLSLSINAQRFLDFLMIEHMRHSGKCNGFLLAPRRQLWDFNIGAHYVSGAIAEAEHAGLIHCRRGTGRRPSYYGLAWLPQGSAPVVSAVSTQNECSLALTKPVASAERHSQGPKSSSAKQHSPSRDSYHGGDVSSVLEGKGEGVEAGGGIDAGRPDRPSPGKSNGRAEP